MSVILETNDGNTYTIKREYAMHSNLIKSYIEDNDDENIKFYLKNVNTENLEHIIEFIKYFSVEPMTDIPKPLISTNMSEYVQEWYSNFVDKEQDKLMELILAANYMDIKPLLNLCCAKVATMIKDLTPKEIREKFNIENDFTSKKEEQLI